MSTDSGRTTERLAQEVADGKVVDWERLELQGDVLPQELEALRFLERVRKIHKPSTRDPGIDRDTTGSVADEAYEVLEKIGSGAFADVYRARDRGLDRVVALKVFPPRKDLTEEGIAHFAREAHLLASLDHENIVTIHSVDPSGGGLRMVLEYVDGRTFEEIVKEDGPLGEREAALIGCSLARALAAIHSKGMVHLDVKPANAMRAKGGRTVLLDFGISRRLAGKEGLPGPTGGTPLFMAPEQLEVPSKIGPASDVYALGVTLYWLVSGKHPVSADSPEELRRKVREGSRRPLVDCKPNVAPAFAAICERALQTAPQDRYASAGALEGALRGFLAEATERSRRRIRLASLAAGIIVLFATPFVLDWSRRAALGGAPLADAAFAAPPRLMVAPEGDEYHSFTFSARLPPGASFFVEAAVRDDLRAKLVLATYVGRARSVYEYEPVDERLDGSTRVLRFGIRAADGRFRAFAAPDLESPVLALLFESAEPAEPGALEAAVEGLLEDLGGWPAERAPGQDVLAGINPPVILRGPSMEPWLDPERDGPRLLPSRIVEVVPLLAALEELAARFGRMRGFLVRVEEQENN